MQRTKGFTVCDLLGRPRLCIFALPLSPPLAVDRQPVIPPVTLTSESLAELAEALDNASDEERSRAVGEIIRLGNEDPTAFTSAVRGLPVVRHSPLFWYYEAIAKDASNWKTFIVEEVNRLLEKMDEIDFGSDLLLTLEALGAARDEAVRLAVTQAVIARSTSPSAKVRRAVADLLAEFAEPEDWEAARVFEAYASDPDWRVRVLARQTVNEDHGRPLNDGISFADRLRIRFFNLYDWK